MRGVTRPWLWGTRQRMRRSKKPEFFFFFFIRALRTQRVHKLQQHEHRTDTCVQTQRTCVSPCHARFTARIERWASASRSVTERHPERKRLRLLVQTREEEICRSDSLCNAALYRYTVHRDTAYTAEGHLYARQTRDAVLGSAYSHAICNEKCLLPSSALLGERVAATTRHRVVVAQIALSLFIHRNKNVRSTQMFTWSTSDFLSEPTVPKSVLSKVSTSEAT